MDLSPAMKAPMHDIDAINYTARIDDGLFRILAEMSLV
jgi:hypothetical protein